MEGLVEKRSISLELATEMCEAALLKAKELQIKVSMAIVDDGGNLVPFRRMDGAPYLGIDISINKAYTSSSFGFPTHEWYERMQKNPVLREGIVHTPRFMMLSGGYPIKWEGYLVGSIGVSGGSGEQDLLCCEAAIKKFEELCLNKG